MDNLLSKENMHRFFDLADKVKEHGPDSLTPAELEWAQTYISAVIEEIVVPLVRVLKDAAQQIAVALTAAMDALTDAAWTSAQLQTKKASHAPAPLFIDPASQPIPRLSNIPPQINMTSDLVGKLDDGLARQIQRDPRRNRYSS